MTSGKLLLCTARLTVRELDLSMAHCISRLSQDDAMRRFMPDEVFETDADAAAILALLISQYGRCEGPLVYAVLLQDQEVIGHVEAAPLENGEWEIGYHIGAGYVRNGYATEALQTFLPFIIEQLQQPSLYGVCVEENVASQRVLEKCGFQLQYKGVGPYQGCQRPLRKYRWPSVPVAPRV